MFEVVPKYGSSMWLLCPEEKLDREAITWVSYVWLRALTSRK